MKLRALAGLVHHHDFEQLAAFYSVKPASDGTENGARISQFLQLQTPSFSAQMFDALSIHVNDVHVLSDCVFR
jgi:hypothetical protein